MLNNDQHFLLLFIMGTYFAPHLHAEKYPNKKSALQRLSEGLPPYTSEQLVKTKMKILVAEQVYYHVLRRANKSLLVKLPTFRQFFQGVLSTPPYDPNTYQRQFPDLFPMYLHPQARHRDRYKTIESIVFINNPDISYMKAEDVERFKRLTGLENFVLDEAAVEMELVGAIIKETKVDCSQSGWSQKALSYSHIGSSSVSSQKRKRSIEMHIPPLARPKPVMLMLPNHPTDEEWSNIVAATRNGVEMSGTIAERPAGPLVGLVDIGVCEDSYFFQVSLPGVGRNESDEFKCTVDSASGRVSIEGKTKTGRKYFVKGKKIYKMQTQNLCPAGAFKVSFQLPGPVHARTLDANIEDGILEGVVSKQ